MNGDLTSYDDDICKIEWLTIPAPDLDVAKRFYSACFCFTYEDYNDRYVIFKAGNISGGLDQDQIPSNVGIGFSITVPTMTKAVKQVIDNGGKILRQPYEIGPSAGFCTKFSDPNGNVLELYSSIM